jgi:Protein of unknown function (DUF1236)
MLNRWMITVAAAALLAGTGLAHAQGTGMSKEAPPTGVQQGAPSSPSAAPMNREGGAEHGMKSTQSEEKMQPQGSKSQRAQDMKSPATGEKSGSAQYEKGAAGKEMKSEGREDRSGNMKAESREERSGVKTESREGRSETIGQAGAGRPSTEQRTRITTVIREQHIAPVTSVNFAIAVGTRVPREVGFHPLPAEIVTIYPDWRGFEFFLVRGEIVVVDPQTLQIVAVLPA